ncbi:MAG: type II secretion system F family protein [Planctomycetes bacterium]|nr:type II secretion system F family protein [Planctomycetota bacterium]
MAKSKFNINEITIGGVSQKELTGFTRQFATLANAGLSAIRSLDILINQLKPGVLKKALRSVKEEVEQGTPLSDAMSHQPKAFDTLYVNMIRAGETGGILSLILNRLADFREKAQKMASEIKSAMIYPAAVVIIAVSIVSAIVYFIVPQFEKMFKEMNIELPALTLALLYISNLLQNEAWKPVVGIIVFFVTLTILKKTQRGRYWIDYLKLFMPIFGMIIRKSSVSRFCRTQGTLMDSGVPILEALSIMRNASGNEVLGSAIDLMVVAVKQGEPITKPMYKSRIFDEMTISMLEVGDEAGELPKMLTNVADNFDTEVDAMVAGMKSLIEPILIVGLGGAVGFIVIALFMPLIELMNSLG